MQSAAADSAARGGAGLRFLLFGLINAGLTYAVYCTLVLLISPQAAYAIVYALGIGLAWLGNSLRVFRGALRRRSALLYPLLYLLQYLFVLNRRLLAPRIVAAP